MSIGKVSEIKVLSYIVYACFRVSNDPLYRDRYKISWPLSVNQPSKGVKLPGVKVRIPLRLVFYQMACKVSYARSLKEASIDRRRDAKALRFHQP